MRQNADIGRSTWFQVGGPAEWLFRPEDTGDLADFLKRKTAGLPVTVIGVGSNLLIRDGGVEGVVVRLGRGFTECGVLSAERRESSAPGTQHSALHVGAACLDVHVAEFAAQNGVAGLEFLSGIPGTIGGAVAMNAGAYGSDISQVLVEAEIVTVSGEIKRLSNAELDFAYRHSALPEGAIVTSAVLKGTHGEPDAIRARIAEIRKSREDTQPVRSRTGGSTFTNPPGRKAWELIEAAGCRGLKRGGAMVSEKHCNFLINTGTATAEDLEELGEEVRRRVKEKCGVELRWEIRRIGKY